jgi:hypothetical protein
LTPTVHAYINYLRNRNPDSGENIDYNTERAKFIRAKRQNEEYDLRVKERDLHKTEEITKGLTDALVNFKTRLMAIPAKLSPVLSKKTNKAEIHSIIKESVDEALHELAEIDKLFAESEDGGNENGNV